jgi:hypothetical protein
MFLEPKEDQELLERCENFIKDPALQRVRPVFGPLIRKSPIRKVMQVRLQRLPPPVPESARLVGPAAVDALSTYSSILCTHAAHSMCSDPALTHLAASHEVDANRH